MPLVLTASVTMELFCLQQLEELQRPLPNDPLKDCDDSLVQDIMTRPEYVFEIADNHIHTTFPFSDIHVSWLRLYTDVEIALALKLALESSRRSTAETDTKWVDQVVIYLDMAVITAGAVRREEMVNDILHECKVFIDRVCETYMEWDHPSLERRQLGDTFNTSSYHRPEISRPIVKSNMTLTEFERSIEQPAPLVITNALNRWPAFHERAWNNPSYWLTKTFDGRRLVPVELGHSYTDDEWTQKIMRFSDFMFNHLLNDEALTPGYIAQYDLFKQIPSLRSDISVPDFCYTSPPGAQPGTPLYGKELQRIDDPISNVWIGPAGTVSPLHTDGYHNILCQVVGRKYVRLYSPNDTNRLYPRGMEGERGKEIDMSNTTSLPIEMVEMDIGLREDDYLLFRDAPYVETVLEEGECLYIPIGWWHYVRSLTPSVSVNFWWN